MSNYWKKKVCIILGTVLNVPHFVVYNEIGYSILPLFVNKKMSYVQKSWDSAVHLRTKVAKSQVFFYDFFKLITICLIFYHDFRIMMIILPFIWCFYTSYMLIYEVNEHHLHKIYHNWRYKIRCIHNKPIIYSNHWNIYIFTCKLQ